MNRFELQSAALLALARLPKWARPASYPSIAPPGRLHSGGTSISHLYKEIFVERIYAAPEVVPEGGRVLDAGAHVGMASLFFLQEHRHAQVLSVEPNPASAACLRRNLAAYAARTTIVEAALGVSAGRVPFFVTRDEPLNVNAGTTDRVGNRAAVERLEVERVAIASLLVEAVGFAKIDVEGAEYDLLADDAFVPDHVRSLVIEFHDMEANRTRFVRTLARLTGERGYRLVDTHGVAQPLASVRDATGSRVLRLWHPDLAR